MARYARIELPGYMTHVMARGIDGKLIFQEESDYEQFIRRLEKHLGRGGFACIGWCLMPNHYHLILRSEGERLVKLMRPLNGGYALWFNKKYDRRGYLFQDRFKSVVCQNSNYALELIRYVNLNPLRAGLVDNLQALAHYQWCGHAAIMDTSRAFPWEHPREVLRIFGKDSAVARQAYLRFLREGLDNEDTFDPFAAAVVSPDDNAASNAPLRITGIAGDAAFVHQALHAARLRKAQAAARRAAGWTAEKIIAYVAREMKLSANEIYRKGRANARSNARYAAVYLACAQAGIPAVKAGELLGMQSHSASRAFRLGKKVAETLDLRLPESAS